MTPASEPALADQFTAVGRALHVLDKNMRDGLTRVRADKTDEAEQLLALRPSAVSRVITGLGALTAALAPVVLFQLSELRDVVMCCAASLATGAFAASIVYSRRRPDVEYGYRAKVAHVARQLQSEAEQALDALIEAVADDVDRVSDHAASTRVALAKAAARWHRNIGRYNDHRSRRLAAIASSVANESALVHARVERWAALHKALEQLDKPCAHRQTAIDGVQRCFNALTQAEKTALAPVIQRTLAETNDILSQCPFALNSSGPQAVLEQRDCMAGIHLTLERNEEHDCYIVYACCHLATEEDCIAWAREYERLFEPLGRRVDVIIVLDMFSVDHAIGAVWGVYRNRVIERFIRHSVRVDCGSHIFTTTAGGKFRSPGPYATDMRTAYEMLEAARLAQASVK